MPITISTQSVIYLISTTLTLLFHTTMDYISRHIIDYSYSKEELGPHSYDDPFDLADLDQFPPLPSTLGPHDLDENLALKDHGSLTKSYKAALLRTPEEIAANKVQ